MLNFLLYFLKILFYTIGSLIACGILIYICNRVYTYLIMDSIGLKFLTFTSYIGTPIHELGHAIMCLFFGHKIEEIKFYTREEDGTLGYVKHSYKPKNLFHQIGNLFIGLGPIFSGFLVIILLLLLFFKEPSLEFFNLCLENINSGGSVFEILLNTFKLIPLLIFSNTHILIKIFAFIIILSISLHINLSLSDVRNSLIGLGFYAVCMLVFASVTYLFGSNIYGAILSAVSHFCLISCAIFSIVILFAFVNLAIALIIYLTKKFTEI